MIHVQDITKSYGSIEALRGVSFDIQPGEIVGLLGPNGAGKSTAIKIITGFLHPDKGYVEIDGRNVLHDLRAVQAKIGYLSENTPLYPELSVQAYLGMIADLRAIPSSETIRLLSDAIYGTGLQAYLTRSIASLSKGLAAAPGFGAGHLAQAAISDSGRADGRPGSHTNRRDPRPDQSAGARQHHSLFVAYLVRGRGRSATA